jgi:hypothetical protein
MNPTKITVNELNEGQMQKVRDYLAQMPNASHKGSKGELYGRYVKVTADVQASVDRHTAKTSTPWYKNVTFEVQDSGVECKYTAKRNAERSEAVKGLASLVTGFLADK